MVPYSRYGPDARRYFLYYLLHMATLIEIIIDGHSKRFSSSDLGNSKIINCKCWGNCFST